MILTDPSVSCVCLFIHSHSLLSSLIQPWFTKSLLKYPDSLLQGGRDAPITAIRDYCPEKEIGW